MIAYFKSEIEKESVQSTISLQRRESEFLAKLNIDAEIGESYQTIIKEGRNERKLCH
jgi:hypothetical protein